MSVETRNERTPAGAPSPRAQPRAGRLRPKLGWADTLLQVWRAKWLMFLVFLPLVLIGAAIALAVPTKYPASTRLLVRVSEAYVFAPVTAEAARGALPLREEVMQAESELAKSPVIAERVIKRIGLQLLYPQIEEAKLRGASDKADEVDTDALEVFAHDLEVSTMPNSSILKMTYSHQTPQLAADTLNAFVAEYMSYRHEVLDGRSVAGLSEQRALIEGRLNAADDVLRDYLSKSGLGDYDSETAAATALLAELSGDLSRASSSLREAEAKAAGLIRQLASMPREVDLYVETTTEQDLVKLRLEREDLLARYLPDSRAVKDIDRRLAQLEAFLKSGPAKGLRRIGPNPTWQALEADRAAQTANISALAGRIASLATQRAAAEAQLAMLSELEPDFRRLKRERDALEASAVSFAMREQTARAQSELASRSVDNISVYEAARPPARDNSSKQAIVIIAGLAGLLAALIAGLLRAWSIQSFPTANSIERTLNLRVLAATRDR